MAAGGIYMKKNHTKRALVSVLLPIAQLTVFFAFLLLAGLLEVPTDRGSVYTVFALLAVLLMFSLPAVAVVCDIIGAIHSILALKKGESRWKNALIITFAAACTAAAVVFHISLWRGVMSV